MIGSVLGHYRLLELLGKGGMGEVYLAEDTKLQRRVALKTLSPELAKDHDRVQRFEREARAAAALNHPNIVTIHSVETDGDIAFLTLELVEGHTLADTLPASGLPIDRLLAIAIPLTDAVGAAHQRGIVHRDLKPANVMITNDGRVKVLDFGLAKLRDEPQFAEHTVGPTRALTGEGRILGTVAYMSPEQAEGKNVDQRSDVFSLGVMLYEMASGERPFKGDTAMSTLTSIIRDTPRPVSELKQELPSDFARIVRRCLAKDPEDRYQTAKDLRNDLRGLREDLGSGERASVASSPSVSAARPVSSAGVSELAKPPSRRWAIAAVAAVAILAAAVAAWRLSGSREAPAVVHFDPFASIALTRLTTTGTAGLAAVSQDGRYVAHVVTDDRGSSVWLRQVSTSSNVQIVPPEDGRMAGIAFSPSGDYVNYLLYPKAESYASLRQVPGLGGGVRKLIDDIDTAPTFAPDGKRLAFIRGLQQDGTALMLANADGGNVRQLAVRRVPLGYQLNLQTVAWSPDGKVLAAAGFDNSKLAGEVVIVDAASGDEHVLTTGQWRAITALAWTPDGHGLLLSAQEAGGESIGQVWFVPYPSGPVRKITNDLSTYSGISVSADGRSLVTVRAEQRASVWLVPVEGAEPPRALPGAGADDGVQGIAFAPDGKIVYTSTSTGNSDIWIMNADGSNRVQLTTAKSDDVLPTITPDGRFIIFVSERDGQRALWRMDTSGGSQTRLSDEAVNRSNFGPGVTADSRWVFFTNNKRENLKVEVDGHSLGPIFAAASGDAQLPTGLHDVLPLPDGSSLTGHYNDPTVRGERLAIVPIDDPSKAKLLSTVRNNGLLSSDGRNLIYWDNPRGVGNIWRQAIAGGTPVQLTHFDSSIIFHHALAPDAKHMAVVRGSTLSDVILITNRATEAHQP